MISSCRIRLMAIHRLQGVRVAWEPSTTLVAMPSWNEWGEWEGCSASCGGGTQARERSVKKDQEYSGEGCEGVMKTIKSCATEIDQKMGRRSGKVLEENP